MNFERKKLRTQTTVAECFMRTREGRGWTQEYAAKKSGVQKKYIHALEHGQYDVLQAVTYARQYAQRYARALHIPWTDIKELFEAETAIYHPLYRPQLGHSDSSKLKLKMIAPDTRPVHILPRLVKWGTALSIMMILFVYIAFEVTRVFTPPELVILAPERDMIVTDARLLITGSTAPEAIVTINGETTDLSSAGYFEESVYLHEGLNTIRISTRSQRSRERVEMRHILYTPQTQ